MDHINKFSSEYVSLLTDTDNMSKIDFDQILIKDKFYVIITNIKNFKKIKIDEKQENGNIKQKQKQDGKMKEVEFKNRQEIIKVVQNQKGKSEALKLGLTKRKSNEKENTKGEQSNLNLMKNEKKNKNSLQFAKTIRNIENDIILKQFNFETHLDYDEGKEVCKNIVGEKEQIKNNKEIVAIQNYCKPKENEYILIYQNNPVQLFEEKITDINLNNEVKLVLDLSENKTKNNYYYLTIGLINLGFGYDQKSSYHNLVKSLIKIMLEYKINNFIIFRDTLSLKIKDKQLLQLLLQNKFFFKLIKLLVGKSEFDNFLFQLRLKNDKHLVEILNFIEDNYFIRE